MASPFRSAYLSSEKLDIEITPNEARFVGTFRFRMVDPADEYNRTNPAIAAVWVWCPEPPGTSPEEIAFWKTFKIWNSPKELLAPNIITSDTLGFVQRLFNLKFSAGGRDFSPFQFQVYPASDRQMGEPGVASLFFAFKVPQALLVGNDPVTISYRQPLIRTNGQARLFYMPEFNGLPPGTATTNQFYYLITVKASVDCALTGSNGKETFALEPGQSVKLTPKHRQRIRAVVRSPAQSKAP